MKKFSQFLVQKKNRANHFAWDDGDVETDITEYTHDKPHQIDWRHRDIHHDRREPDKGTREHDSFQKHHNELSDIHHEHMAYYKGDSYTTNHYLRHGKHRDEDHHPVEHMHDHIKHMDEVTSHRIEHHHTVYRGGIPKDEHRFPVGHKFQDHGYTGTSFRKGVSDSFDYADAKTKHTKKQIMHVIHVPKGARGHYLNVDDRAGMTSEHELVLHRGTKFKVTHHSEDDHNHFIHSRVIGHHAKKLDHGTPGKAYSRKGHDKHMGYHDDDGVVMTKHEDEKNPDVKHKIHIHFKPGQLEAAKKAEALHKKKQMLDKGIKAAGT